MTSEPLPDSAAGRDAALHDALATLEGGRVQEAQTALAALLDSRPDDPALHDALARAALKSGDAARAMQHAEQAVRAAPGVGGYRATLGLACRAGGMGAAAVAAFRQAIQLDKRDAVARKNLADLLVQRGQFDRAVGQYREAIAARPGFAEAHNNLGNALQLQGKPDAAAGQYRAALAIAPSLVEAKTNLAAILIVAGKAEDALPLLREALAARPDDLAAQMHRAAAAEALGRPDEATALYLKIAAARPGDIDSRLQAGRLALLRGDTDAALALSEAALAIDPLDGRLHHLRGLTLLRRNDLAGAVASLRQYVEIEPQSAIAHERLAGALQGLGQLEDALIHYERAAALDPRLASARVSIAGLNELLGNDARAQQCYEEAIRIDAACAPAYASLGGLLHRLGQAEAAAPLLARAIELRPELPTAHNNLGLLEMDRGNHDAAIACFRRALESNPALAGPASNLGTAYQQLGRLDEAREWYRRALAIEPDQSVALLALGQLDAGDIWATTIRRLERRLEDPRLTDSQRADQLFGLARANEALGSYATAFRQAEQANGIVRRARRGFYDPVISRQRVRQVIDLFTPAFFEARRQYGSRSRVPVFIVGMPRSGSTLIEQIVSSHPDVHGAGELSHIGHLAASLQSHGRATRPFPEGTADLDEPTTLRLAGEYLAALRRLAGGAARVTDKMPFNYFRIGLIALLFPRARIIHCRRDPLDIFVSGYFIKFRNPIPYTGDPFDFAGYYADYHLLMAHWQRVLPSAIMTVDYEDVVMRQAETSRQLVEFCGLEWDERCLAFWDNPRPVRTGSSLQVRQPIYDKSVGKWRHYREFLEPLRAELAGGGLLRDDGGA